MFVRSFHKQIVNGPLTMKHVARNCKLPGSVSHKVLLSMTVSQTKPMIMKTKNPIMLPGKFFPFTASHKTLMKYTQSSA